MYSVSLIYCFINRVKKHIFNINHNKMNEQQPGNTFVTETPKDNLQEQDSIRDDVEQETNTRNETGLTKYPKISTSCGMTKRSPPTND